MDIDEENELPNVNEQILLENEQIDIIPDIKKLVEIEHCNQPLNNHVSDYETDNIESDSDNENNDYSVEKIIKEFKYLNEKN